MKVKVNLTNQTLECLDNKPYIQGYDTRNKLIVYVDASVTLTNIQIAYQLQNGRNTIKLPNNGIVEATLEDETTPNPDYIEGYNGFIFNAFTNAGEPLAVTNQAGNFTATLVFKVSGNTYKLNVLNTVLKSTDFEEFENAVEGVAQEVLFSLESMSDIVAELQQTVDDIAANDFSEDEAKEIFYTKTQSDSKYAKFKLVTNIANIPVETLESLEIGDILVSGAYAYMVLKGLQAQNTAFNRYIYGIEDTATLKVYWYEKTSAFGTDWYLRVLTYPLARYSSTDKLNADYIQDGTNNKVFTGTEQTKLSGIEAGAEVNVIEGIKVNGTAQTPDANKIISLTIPTQASDVNALPSSTKYCASCDLTINSSTYVMSLQLKDQNGNNLGTAKTIDLPLETMVVSGSYDSATKKVVLTLQNGQTIEFSVADLVSGLQTEITAQNKLSSDLVDDTNQTNKFVTSDFITKVNAILKYQSEQYGVIAEVINAEEYFSAPTAEISHLTVNEITLGFQSGQNLETILNGIVELAEGKTQNIVIDDSVTGTNVVNTSFNSTNATVTLTISGNKVVDVNNVNHDLSDFKVGDIISITNTNVPDRWVGSINGGNIVFYPLETKLNIDATPTASSTNPVSSGGVYQALSGKQDVATAQAEDNKSLYHLGEFDTVSTVNGITTITRQTGYITIDNVLHAYLNSTPPYPNFALELNLSYFGLSTNDIKTNKNITCYSIVNANNHLSLNFSRATNFNSTEELKQFIQDISIQYQTTTSYTEQVIPNQPLNTLDQNGSQWLRKEWEKGLNLWNEKWEVGSLDSNGQNITESSTIRSKNFIKCLPNTNYICSLGSSAVIYFYNSNGTNIPYTDTDAYNNGYNGNGYFTTPNNTAYMKFRTSGYGTTYNYDIMLNEGDHAYPYQPYYGGIVREKEFKEAINELDISKNRKLIFTGTGQNIKTVGGFSLDGAGNIPFPTAAYHAYQLTLYANGYIPVFRTNLIVSTTASSYNSGVLTKSEGLDVLTQISDEYNTDEYICQNLQPNASYWDGSQLQVTCPNATAVQYLEQQIQLDVIDNTGTSISTIYTGDIGDDSTGDYFFYLWEV